MGSSGCSGGNPRTSFLQKSQCVFRLISGKRASDSDVGGRWQTDAMPDTAEHRRLAESPGDSDPWRLWGPYLSGRQWGTVREDYSADGDAWSFFPFDDAHRRAYRWGE